MRSRCSRNDLSAASEKVSAYNSIIYYRTHRGIALECMAIGGRKCAPLLVIGYAIPIAVLGA